MRERQGFAEVVAKYCSNNAEMKQQYRNEFATQGWIYAGKFAVNARFLPENIVRRCVRTWGGEATDAPAKQGVSFGNPSDFRDADLGTPRLNPAYLGGQLTWPSSPQVEKIREENGVPPLPTTQHYTCFVPVRYVPLEFDHHLVTVGSIDLDDFLTIQDSLTWDGKVKKSGAPKPFRLKVEPLGPGLSSRLIWMYDDQVAAVCILSPPLS